MLEIEYLLLTAVASLMASDALPVMPELDRAGVHLGLHLRTWFQWHRIRIGQDFRTPKTVHGWKARLRQIHPFGYQLAAGDLVLQAAPRLPYAPGPQFAVAHRDDRQSISCRFKSAMSVAFGTGTQ